MGSSGEDACSHRFCRREDASSMRFRSVCVLILGVGQMPASAQPASSGAQAYMGVGSCSAPQCHGSLSPLTTSKAGVRQNEYTHWVSLEKHSKAYEVLLRERSLVMAKNLKMPEAPAQSERCLVCHAMYAPKELQGAKYQLEDGVSCEACHGPCQGLAGEPRRSRLQ